MDKQLPLYQAFCRGQTHLIRAESLYAAKLEAIKHFDLEKKQEHRVAVMLLDNGTGPITHVLD